MPKSCSASYLSRVVRNRSTHPFIWDGSWYREAISRSPCKAWALVREGNILISIRSSKKTHNPILITSPRRGSGQSRTIENSKKRRISKTNFNEAKPTGLLTVAPPPHESVRFLGRQPADRKAIHQICHV